MDNPRVDVIGGSSLPSRISILSNKYKATGRLVRSKDGNRIECTIHRSTGNRALEKLGEGRWVFVPLVLQLAVFVATMLPWRIRFVYGALITLLLASRWIPGTEKIDLVPAYVLQALGGVLVVGCILFLKRTAPWHGAEHMAIAAYWRTGSSELASMRLESPINDRCGGRYFVPLVFSISVALLIRLSLIDVHVMLIWLGIVEILLRVGKPIGLERIPGFQPSSTLLQKYITTTRPGERELMVAQAALEKLVAAHRENQA